MRTVPCMDQNTSPINCLRPVNAVDVTTVENRQTSGHADGLWLGRPGWRWLGSVIAFSGLHRQFFRTLEVHGQAVKASIQLQVLGCETEHIRKLRCACRAFEAV